MFSKSPLFMTLIFGFLFTLFSLPLSAYALPTPAPAPVALALPAALPHNPASLMGRVYTKFNNHARTPVADATDGAPSADLFRRGMDVEEQPTKRDERFQRRLERARRFAHPSSELAINA